MTRECGDCRLCCKLIGVAVLEKPPERWCHHACQRGCGIYETRPEECRTFRCLWLDGVLPEHLKPNHIKAVVYGHTLDSGVNRVVLHEDPSMPGAYERHPEFRGVAEALVKKGFEFAVVSCGTRRLFTGK